MQLTASGLTYTYPGRPGPALTGIDLQLDRGTTALVGVNGAGKTTLLAALARVLRPDDGVVTLDGEDVHRSSRRVIAPRIGLMPQEFTVPAGSRVLDSLLYLAWLKRVPVATGEARARVLLDALGLGARSREQVSALSGGMVRRLALAQALISAPEVLLLDEPTTGLDPEQRVAVRELLADERFRAPITMVSSHVMEDVELLADQVVLIESGAVAFAGSLEQFCLRSDGVVEDAESAFIRRLVDAR